MIMKKKWMSFVLAAVLCVSLAAPASAAESRSISDAAGETVVVHVTHINADGKTTENYVNVDIPAAATSAMEEELIQTAALATINSAASTSTDFDYLCQAAVNLTSTYKYLTSIYLEHDYTHIVFQFNGGTCTDNPTTVTLRLTDDSSNVFTLSSSLSVQTGDLKCAEVIIYNGRTYGGITATLFNGGYFEMDAKVNRGSASFTGFLVRGYY